MTKFKDIFQGKDAVSRFIAELHQFLKNPAITKLIKINTHKNTTNVDDFYRPNIVLRSSDLSSLGRLWIVPTISDYSQNDFCLDINICESVSIPFNQLKAFASKPLAPINLNLFVQHLTRAQ